MKKIILIAAAFALFPFGAQAVELDTDTNGYLDADKGGRNAALGTAAEAATGDFDAAGAAATVEDLYDTSAEIQFLDHTDWNYTNLHFARMPASTPGWVLISTYRNE
jgi:hypothetical protein